MAFDELTDVTDTAHLVLFIRGVNAKFEMTVGWASVKSLNEQDIFKKVEKTLIQCNLKWNLPRCITTDGGKSMCGAEKAQLDKCKSL